MHARQSLEPKTTFNSDETIILAQAYEAACNAASRAGILSDSLRSKIAQHVYDSATRDDLDVKEIARRATDQLVRPIIHG